MLVLWDFLHNPVVHEGRTNHLWDLVVSLLEMKDWSREGDKIISKILNVPRNTLKAIVINRWRKRGKTVTLPRKGCPSERTRWMIAKTLTATLWAFCAKICLKITKSRQGEAWWWEHQSVLYIGLLLICWNWGSSQDKDTYGYPEVLSY